MIDFCIIQTSKNVFFFLCVLFCLDIHVLISIIDRARDKVTNEIVALKKLRMMKEKGGVTVLINNT